MRIGRVSANKISAIEIDANVAMSGYKLTGLGAGAAQDESIRKGRAEILIADQEADAVLTAAEAIAAAKTDTALLNPSGMIILWHGTIANIPSGWVICDGNSSTPNLLTKFVQGVATAATDPGATGGEATHVLTESELASHTHGYKSHHTITNYKISDLTSQSGGNTSKTSSSQTSDSAGSGSAHENEPTFYDVAFIMKT